MRSAFRSIAIKDPFASPVLFFAIAGLSIAASAFTVYAYALMH